MTEKRKDKPKGKIKGKDKRKKKKQLITAATSDRHILYELSVQCTESEMDFVDETWMKLRSRHATRIREDFCGTAASSMEWVRRRPDNVAYGVDLDEAVLAWSRAVQEKRLTDEQRSRLTISRDDVRTVDTGPMDTVLAMNFSYNCFKTREALRAYFAHVRESLVEDGIFILDAYGGSDSFVEDEEERWIEEGFTYVWETQRYNPITGEARMAIHFRFEDGTELENAFTYEWRLWTLPELQELLAEAGFREVTVYWEGTDKHGEGDGNFKATTEGEACEGWIAYIVAEK